MSISSALDKNKFVVLDFIRGFCAVLVCMSHLRAALLYDFNDLIAPGIMHKVFYFITGLGHQSVMIFFVLSGFFVGGSVLNAGKKFCLIHYSIARLTRLWTVLIPALLLTFVIDIVLQFFYPSLLREGFQVGLNSWPSIGYSTSISSFFGNLFFLQTILTPVFGSNGPLWSLSNEFWYYVIFPLLIISLSANVNFLFWRIISMVLVGAILYLLPGAIISAFIVWLMGVFAYVAYKRLIIRARPIALATALSFLVAALVNSKSAYLKMPLNISSDYVIGFSFAFTCVILVVWPISYQTVFGALLKRVSVWLSKISYSLYLSLFPFVVLLSASILNFVKIKPDFNGILLYFILLSLLIAIGFGFWFLFERNTDAVRQQFTKMLKNFNVVI